MKVSAPPSQQGGAFFLSCGRLILLPSNAPPRFCEFQGQDGRQYIFSSLGDCAFSGSISALNQTPIVDRIRQTEAAIPSQDFLLQKFPKWTPAHWGVSIFAISFLILALLPEGRLNDFEVPLGAETVRVARSLAARGAFADPFAVMPTGPTAHLAPVYPFLYSVILRLFGSGYTALRIAWVFNLACFALQMGLLPLLSYRLRLGVLPGVLAAGLGTFSLHAPIDTRWESFLAGTLLLLAYVLTDQAFRRRNIAIGIVSGVLWAVVILMNPVAVLLLIAWPLCFVLSDARSKRHKNTQRLAVVTLTALLVVSPWIIRNYARFGTFIFVRDNLGLELYTGNNDCAAPDLKTNIQSGCHARTHPNPTAAVAAQLVAAGEVSFYRAKLHEAIAWISTHRAAFLRLSLQRFRLFWFPDADRAWESVLVWAITLLSFPGLFLLIRKNRCAACVIATAWVLFPLIYYVVPFEPRYRYPIYWTSLLPAGYALSLASRKLPYFRPKLPATNESG